MLELKRKNIGLKIRIIHELSSLEPVPKVCHPKYRSDNEDIYLIAQHAVRRAVLDALNGWVLDVVVSIAVTCPTGCCYVVNIK